ncbi:hypothetical protein N9043_00835 [bacterium]|nr:hypothetical protein [bacterium]
MKELTIEEAGAISVYISEQVKPELTASEQGFFVAGFQECIKYLDGLNIRNFDSFNKSVNLKWPDKEGFYWFYGHLWGGEEPELALGESIKYQNGFALKIKGDFIWHEKSANGIFIPATLPELPKEFK